MEATRTTGIISVGRKLIGIAVLAISLVYGPLALTAPGDGADRAETAACGASAALEAVSVGSGVEWSSSPSMPGEPY